MRKILVSFVVVMLAGCAGKPWYRPDTTEYQFENDKAACQLVALNAGNQAAAANRPAPSTTTFHNGSVYGAGGSANYYGTSTTVAAPDFSGVIGAAANASAFSNCLRSKGYRQVASEPDGSSLIESFKAKLSMNSANDLSKCFFQDENGRNFTTYTSKNGCDELQGQQVSDSFVIPKRAVPMR